MANQFKKPTEEKAALLLERLRRLPNQEHYLQAETPDRQDRATVVLQLTYMQWDAAPWAQSVRSSRLVDESAAPLMYEVRGAAVGERCALRVPFACELCVVNRTGYFDARPIDQKVAKVLAEQGAAVWLYRDGQPVAPVRPGRHAFLEAGPGSEYAIEAIAVPATLLVMCIPT